MPLPRARCPREHLEFSLWYLKENGLVTRMDNGRFAVTAKGEAALNKLGPEIRAVNDDFFKPLDRSAFLALASAAAALVESSSKIERRLRLMDDDEWLALRRAAE